MNDNVTRARLVREAQRLFALRGFRGASVREITRAAQANLGAITYHFGSKEALYNRVLEAVFAELAARVESAAAEPGTAPARLAAVVRALFAFFDQHPDAPRLVLREIATDDRIPDVAVPYLRRNLAAIHRVLLEGQAASELRQVDPTLVAFTLISQSIWFALVGRSLSTVLGDVDHRSFAERVERHVTDVVNRFIARET